MPMIMVITISREELLSSRIIFLVICLVDDYSPVAIAKK